MHPRRSKVAAVNLVIERSGGVGKAGLRLSTVTLASTPTTGVASPEGTVENNPGFRQVRNWLTAHSPCLTPGYMLSLLRSYVRSQSKANASAPALRDRSGNEHDEDDIEIVDAAGADFADGGGCRQCAGEMKSDGGGWISARRANTCCTICRLFWPLNPDILPARRHRGGADAA